MKKQFLLIASSIFALSLTSCGGESNAPQVDLENKTVTYGLYPQKRILDSDTVLSDLKELTLDNIDENSGWYLYKGEYYAKVISSPMYGDGAAFENGDKIGDSNEYWFKCEPITWKILASNEDSYLITTELLLDNGAYSVDSAAFSYYDRSNVREYLNSTFLEMAFFKDKGENILTTKVDNSNNITPNGNYDFSSDDTDDKVFVLSYNDLLNSEYGFSSENTNENNGRKVLVTDYARAKGAVFNKEGFGTYWTRSPDRNKNSYVYKVNYEGVMESTHTGTRNIGMRPCINIKK